MISSTAMPSDRLSKSSLTVASGDQMRHATVAQHVHVRDRLGAGDHARGQRRHLRPRLTAGTARHRQSCPRQLGQPRPLRQRHRRHQAGGRHETRIIKAREPDRIDTVRNLAGDWPGNATPPPQSVMPEPNLTPLGHFHRGRSK